MNIYELHGPVRGGVYQGIPVLVDDVSITLRFKIIHVALSVVRSYHTTQLCEGGEGGREGGRRGSDGEREGGREGGRERERVIK